MIWWMILAAILVVVGIADHDEAIGLAKAQLGPGRQRAHSRPELMSRPMPTAAKPAPKGRSAGLT